MSKAIISLFRGQEPMRIDWQDVPYKPLDCLILLRNWVPLILSGLFLLVIAGPILLVVGGIKRIRSRGGPSIRGGLRHLRSLYTRLWLWNILYCAAMLIAFCQPNPHAYLLNTRADIEFLLCFAVIFLLLPMEYWSEIKELRRRQRFLCGIVESCIVALIVALYAQLPQLLHGGIYSGHYIVRTLGGGTAIW